MGGSFPVSNEKRLLEECFQVVMPVYYTEVAPTPHEIDLALTSFNHIRDDTSTRYIEMRKDPNFRFDSCLKWFYHKFYERLFDVQPQTRVMFSKISPHQGHGLAMMITLSLRQLKNPPDFRESMIALARRHFERSVKAIEYGIFGDVLFWTLYHVLPPEAFDGETERAWVKIYSAMLTLIVPAALKCELEHPFSCPQRSEALMRCDPQPLGDIISSPK